MDDGATDRTMRSECAADRHHGGMASATRFGSAAKQPECVAHKNGGKKGRGRLLTRPHGLRRDSTSSASAGTRSSSLTLSALAIRARLSTLKRGFANCPASVELGTPVCLASQRTDLPSIAFTARRLISSWNSFLVLTAQNLPAHVRLTGRSTPPAHGISPT